MFNVTVLTSSIKTKNAEIETLRSLTKDLYGRLTDGLAASNNIITKGIDQLYKEIDATFNKKSKLEQEVMVLTQHLHKELGI